MWKEQESIYHSGNDCPVGIHFESAFDVVVLRIKERATVAINFFAFWTIELLADATKISQSTTLFLLVQNRGASDSDAENFLLMRKVVPQPSRQQEKVLVTCHAMYYN